MAPALVGSDDSIRNVLKASWKHGERRKSLIDNGWTPAGSIIDSPPRCFSVTPRAVARFVFYSGATESHVLPGNQTT